MDYGMMEELNLRIRPMQIDEKKAFRHIVAR